MKKNTEFDNTWQNVKNENRRDENKTLKFYRF